MLTATLWFRHGHTDSAAVLGLQLTALLGSRAGCSALLSYQLEEVSLQFASWATTSSSDWKLERGGPEKAIPVADRGRL